MAKRARTKEATKTVVITVDGTRHFLYPDLIDGVLSLKFRRALGMGVQEALLKLSEHVEIDLLAGLVWLARLQAKDNVLFEQVASQITVTTEFDVQEEGGEADSDDSPDDNDPNE